MQKKPILIICIAIVIIAVILLIIYLAKGGSTDINDIKNGTSETKADVPVITLDYYPKEETDGDVEISIIAKIDGNNVIDSITTPDGKTTGYNENKKFTVSENGQYTFSVKASNGQETSETIEISNILKISADNPYIPEGFTHVEGTEVKTGFIIEDENKNQFVWVPVETGSIISTSPSDKYYEDDDTASSLANSVAKYYGFYIARFESSKDVVNGLAVSKSTENSIPWSNINYSDAYDAAKNTAIAFNYSDVKTALVNSYAWDTTLNWLNSSVINYSTSRNYGNYSNQILNTGATETDIINGIADMSGNLREWTTEKYDETVNSSSSNSVTNEANSDNNDNTVSEESDEYRVIRGGSATMDKIANSRIGERIDLQDNYWGFRMILYKD